jgi:hypothetical protein
VVQNPTEHFLVFPAQGAGYCLGYGIADGVWMSDTFALDQLCALISQGLFIALFQNDMSHRSSLL